jgi:hypothetical protein
MFKGIATVAFGLFVALTVAVVISQPQPSTASVSMPNTTVVHKNSVFPLPGDITVESCKVSICADA